MAIYTMMVTPRYIEWPGWSSKAIDSFNIIKSFECWNEAYDYGDRISLIMLCGPRQVSVSIFNTGEIIPMENSKIISKEDFFEFLPAKYKDILIFNLDIFNFE